MRLILFRGKRIDTGEWVYGDLIKHYENQRRFIVTDELAFSYPVRGAERIVSDRAHEVITETVGQYTGVDDRGGRRIFEGDILYDCVHDLYGVVEFVESLGGWWYFDRNRFGTSLEFDEFDALTIVGNIFDTPELMKQGE